MGIRYKEVFPFLSTDKNTEEPTEVDESSSSELYEITGNE
jgi:hypothetical protein